MLILMVSVPGGSSHTLIEVSLTHSIVDLDTLLVADAAPSLIIWFFDSRSGFTFGKNPKGIPDWVDDSVAIWLKAETALMDATWGPSGSRAAMAFVHVPL